MKARQNQTQDKIIFKKAVVGRPRKFPPALKEIEVEPPVIKRRQLFWVYDQDGQIVDLEPASCYDDKQAINDLLIKNIIWGDITKYTAKNYLICPCCQAEHHSIFETCPNCGLIFIADEDDISEDDM